MPFINTKTTVSLDKTKRDSLTAALGKITSSCLNKGETWIMTGYEDNASLYFQGNQNGDTAYVEVKLFGTPSASGCAAMTKEVCALYEKELGIPAERIYVSYYPTENWGWNGNNF